MNYDVKSCDFTTFGQKDIPEYEILHHGSTRSKLNVRLIKQKTPVI